MTAPSPARRGLSAAALVALALAGTAGAQPRFPEAVTAARLGAWLRTDEGLGVRPLRELVNAPLDAPTVIHFRVAPAAPFRRLAAAASDDDAIIHVIDSGQVAPDSTIGYALVQALKPGSAVVRIGGARVTVAADPSPLIAAPGSARPTIVTPIAGAAAWGWVTVSVSWWRPAAPSTEPPVLLVSGAEAPLVPAWTTRPDDGPTGLAAYLVNTAALAGADTLELTPAWPSSPSAPAGDPVRIRVFHPAPGSLIAGECESEYDLPPLPEERKEPKARIVKNDQASGGAFFDNAGSVPHFRFPLEVPAGAGAGWYQVMLVAGGDPAAATLPSVGVTIDEAQYPVTRAPIAQPAFHRCALGLPVRLEPGKHVLRVDFLNDFYAAGGADRNLRLDKIEVLRVADAGAPGAPAAAQGEAGAMMAAANADQTMTAMAPARAPTAVASASPAGEAMMSSGAMMGAAPAPAADTWPASAAARAASGDPPVIAFARPLDGAVACGDLDIRAAAWWPGAGDKSGPLVRTRLMLNGRIVGEQFAAAPRFVVPWASLAPGANALVLLADGPAFSIRSAEAVVTADKPAGEPASPQLASFFRFTARDPRWDAAARALLSPEQNPPERSALAMFSNADAVLHLPPDLAGDFLLDVEARGQSFNGPPELACSLASGDAEPVPLGTIAINGGWDTFPVLSGKPGGKNRAPVVLHLAPGPKALHIAFINDAYEPGKGDRNAFVQAAVLRDAAAKPAAERTLRVDVLYPADGQTVRAGGADAVVFAPAGSAQPRAVELLIDGQPSGQVIDTRGRLGPLVFPVSLRSVAPGEHDLALRLTDATKTTATTASRRVRVLPADSAEPTTYERAVALLDRFGFGPDERTLADVLTRGEATFLDQALRDGPDAPAVAAARALAAARYPNSSSGGDVQRRAILEALATDNPVRARFVLWTENHFSTWIRKTESRRKADEHERFSRLGVAPFPDLLLASATSPAMLRYLDQEQSFNKRLNENYAREIMELHTLGVHGGYTQEDVTTLARILTGWTTTREAFIASADSAGDGVGPDEYGLRETFRFEPALADTQARTFLGRRFAPLPGADRYGRVLAAIGMLAGHPSTARFISGKLIEHYLIFPAPDDARERLASVFEQTGGDTRSLLLALAHDPLFSKAPPRSRLCHPPDFAFRLARCANSTDAQAVHDYLNLAGHGMFDRSTPDGYQENDAEEMDSNAMLQRWKLARRLETALFELIPSARRAGDKPVEPAELQATIDLLAIRLTGRLLTDASNAAAINLFNATEGKRDERFRVLAPFIPSLPEAQLK